MQAVKSLLTQELAEMKNKPLESGGVTLQQFTNLPKSVAASLGYSLQREQAGLQATGTSLARLSMSCYGIADCMSPVSSIDTSDGEVLGKLDYLQAAAHLSPTSKFLWQALADSLGENQTVTVGQQLLNKSECLVRSAPPAPIRVKSAGKAPENQPHTHQGTGAQNFQHRSLENKQSQDSSG